MGYVSDRGEMDEWMDGERIVDGEMAEVWCYVRLQTSAHAFWEVWSAGSRDWFNCLSLPYLTRLHHSFFVFPSTKAIIAAEGAP